jgi:uncharacterized protein (DUF58 family)
LMMRSNHERILLIYVSRIWPCCLFCEIIHSNIFIFIKSFLLLLVFLLLLFLPCLIFLFSRFSVGRREDRAQAQEGQGCCCREA